MDKGNPLDVTLLLTAIKCGLYSQDFESAKTTVSLLMRVSEAFASLKSKPHHSVISQWFVRINSQPLNGSMQLKSVLRGLAEAIDTHPSIVNEAAKLIFSICQRGEPSLTQLTQVFKDTFDDDEFMIYETMHECLPVFNKLDRDATRKSILESDLIQSALQLATTTNDLALRLKTTNLILELWYLYPTLVSSNQQSVQGLGSMSLRDSFHQVLMMGTKERDKIFKINVFGMAFTLLDRLAEKENKEAPQVYKTIILGLVESYKNKRSDREIDQVTTEMILRSFISIFKSHETIPKHLLLDPFLN